MQVKLELLSITLMKEIDCRPQFQKSQQQLLQQQQQQNKQQQPQRIEEATDLYPIYLSNL
jgi:hypothetical protein